MLRNISFLNVESLRLHRSGLKTFPAILNKRFTGAYDAGIEASAIGKKIRQVQMAAVRAHAHHVIR